MVGQTTVWFEGNSMMVQLVDTTDESDGSDVTTGVAFQAQVYDEDGVLRTTVTMTHQGEGTWQGIASVTDVDPHIEIGDQIKVVYLGDGGGPTSQYKSTARPEVEEREA